MYQSLQNVMSMFNGIWTGNAAMNAVVVTLSSLLGLLNLAGTTQKNASKGITQSKAKARAGLIQMAITHSAAGMAYAASIGNTTLQVDSKILESTLSRATDVALADICQTLYNLLNPYAASLTSFGANAATLTAFQTAITAYQPLSQQPKNARSAKKSATLNVLAQLAAIDSLIKEQLDPLMVQFRTTEVDFYNQYMGLRHTEHTSELLKKVSIFLYVKTATGLVLPNAEIKLSATQGAKRNKFSKADGSMHFARLKPDTYTITVTLPGYVTQTQSITATTPQKLSVNFVMVSAGTGTVSPVNPN
jgi:hypothetical protein